MKISCIYRPPRGDYKKCIDKIKEIVTRKENFKKEIWLLGDFNVDYLKRSDPNQKRFLSLFKTFGLSQTITSVTRPGNKAGSCIDWIVTNCRFVRYANVTNIFISDHFAIECVRKKARERNTTVLRDVRCFEHYDKNVLSDLLYANLINTAFDVEIDPNVKWNLLYQTIYDIMSVMCPYKKFRQREIVTPWITADIYRNIRYRDSLVNLYRITKNNLYLTLMKQQRNIVNSMIESAKKAYISGLLDNNATSPKKFWKYINQFLKGDYRSYLFPNFIDPNSGLTISSDQTATFLNEFFCNTSTRLGFDTSDNVAFVANDYMDMYNYIEGTFDLFTDPPTIDEVLLYSNDIEISKCCCVEGLTSSICKDLLTMRPAYFVSLFQASFSTNTFPTSWSKGIVTVIPKSGDLSNPSNWRPITQTPVFAKIMEKIVYTRVNNYFIENNILSPYQYGFRQGKSTHQAVFDLSKFIYSGLNHKKIVSTICLDVAKAFDSINHNILLYKLSKIGFSDKSVKWFKSYLTRTQVVQFDKNISPESPVVTGIGQGTILGPMLFIFYINDITSVTNHLKINMYADDCILYTSGNEWNRMKQKIQPEISKIQRWYTDNRLKVNVDKSKVLLFGSRNKLGKVDMSNKLILGNSPLIFTTKYKYLGVTLDSEMSLTALLADAKKTVSNRLFNLRKLRQYITEKTALTIYKQTILPVFDYAGFMIISCNKSDRHDLQIIQNDALRTCYNVKRRDRLSIASMHKRSHLLSLEQRRTFQLLNLMYMHKNNPQNLRIAPRQTRGADRQQFNIERYNNLKYKNSPFYKGAELWNLLPLDIVTSESIYQFKKSLKNRYKTYVDTLA